MLTFGALFSLFLLIAVQTQTVSPLTETFLAATMECSCRKKNFSNLKHQLPPGFVVSPSEEKRRTSFYTPFCSSRSSVLLGEIHRRGGRDTDFYTDGSLSNPEGNTAIKHVVF